MDKTGVTVCWVCETLSACALPAGRWGWRRRWWWEARSPCGRTDRSCRPCRPERSARTDTETRLWSVSTNSCRDRQEKRISFIWSNVDILLQHIQPGFFSCFQKHYLPSEVIINKYILQFWPLNMLQWSQSTPHSRNLFLRIRTIKETNPISKQDVRKMNLTCLWTLPGPGLWGQLSPAWTAGWKQQQWRGWWRGGRLCEWPEARWGRSGQRGSAGWCLRSSPCTGMNMQGD